MRLVLGVTRAMAAALLALEASPIKLLMLSNTDSSSSATEAE